MTSDTSDEPSDTSDEPSDTGWLYVYPVTNPRVSSTRTLDCFLLIGRAL